MRAFRMLPRTKRKEPSLSENAFVKRRNILRAEASFVQNGNKWTNRRREMRLRRDNDHR